MRRPVRFFLSLLVLVAGLTLPARAQDGGMLASSVELLDRLAAALEGVPADSRGDIYASRRPALAEAAAVDPTLPLVLFVLDAQFGAHSALMDVDRAIDALGPAGGAADWVRAPKHLVGALAESAPTTRASPAALYSLFESLEKLNAATGGAFEVTGAAAPEIVALFEQALKWGKAGLSADEIARQDGKDFDRFVRDVTELIPATLSPALAGPAGVAFADKLEWDREMWREATNGIDVVTDAIRNGQVDETRLAAVTGRIEDLARRGPWGGDTAKEFIKRWAESLPGVGKLVKALWPSDAPPEPTEPTDADCSAVNCDCDNLTLDIGGVFRQDCLATEQELIEQCQTTGAISGTCHPTASGENAFPPG